MDKVKCMNTNDEHEIRYLGAASFCPDCPDTSEPAWKAWFKVNQMPECASSEAYVKHGIDSAPWSRLLPPKGQRQC